ncbi:hypothetical protein CEUSTIGMA_g2014.t1 [Chlamydomonas eustigma]|uniref:Uncharacterized protein n=1 Tax=Chlamydomonas eustigma TaxID=1157962 RepID=A0A250WUT9_9CHLO|nr:hypothetical protein CEUSTIGMA_g2014.t1 [Chlamydomonas eustigma]|eukprot:GAX74565.1 hypothetical protein CEUSTIGMA_g2014.t1 [Chlamydomonas eustigma]
MFCSPQKFRKLKENTFSSSKGPAVNTLRPVQKPTQIFDEQPVEILRSRANDICLASTSYSSCAVLKDRPASSSDVVNRRVIPKKHVDEQLLKDCATAFKSVHEEYEYWIDHSWVEGNIPPELEGTYFRNGPGLHVTSEVCQRHTFDGDGMVFSVAFKDGHAFFRNKFVRTEGFVKEQEAGRPLLRTTFSKGAADGGLLFNPFDLTFKNVANTGVVYWAGKLYALWEAGRPYELDPQTLVTVGETDMDGLLKGPLGGHYRIYTEADGSKRWVTFGSKIMFGGSSVSFYEFDEAGKCVVQSQHPLSGIDITFVHDMAVTENYYVLVLGPIVFDWRRFATEYLLGRCSIAQCLKFDKGGKVKVLLYPRSDRPDAQSRPPVVATAASTFFPFHHINAYEEPDGRVVIDTIAWNEVDFDMSKFITSPEYYEGGCRPHYVRLCVDPARKLVTDVKQMLEHRTIEFPGVSPSVVGKKHTNVYCIGDTVGHSHLWGPAQALMKISIPQDQGSPVSQARAKYAISRAGLETERAVKASDMDCELPIFVNDSMSDSYLNNGHRLTAEVWEPGPRSFCGEPMVIPKPMSKGEDDAWIIVGVHNASTCKADILIFDAARISDGPLAVLHLPHHLPASFHGSFCNEYLGPDPVDASVPIWKEPLHIRSI